MAKHRFRRLGLDTEAKGLKPWCSDLKLKYLSVRTANNKRLKCFQLERWLFLHYLAEKNEIEHLLLRLLSFDNNLFKNDSKKALAPIKLDKNLGFSYQ